MEIFCAFLVKLTVIFFGSGLMTLFAFWVVKEIKIIPRLILESQQNNKEMKLQIAHYEKVSAESGFYEVSIPEKEPVKIFSSHEGIKII